MRHVSRFHCYLQERQADGYDYWKTEATFGMV